MIRGDIQGLRALAVVAVIAEHARSRWLPGGYVGVDIFFVISGYLITALLLAESRRNGRISLLGFYARRGRRILPAATTVLVATLVAAVTWLSLIDALQVLEDSVWAVLFAANLRFAQRGVDYFAQGEAPSPLQHYWSLAVEEQFYTVWPLIVIALLIWHKRRHPAQDDDPPVTTVPRRELLLTVGAICVLSLAWSIYRSHAEPTWAYFSTFTRAWELGVGAMVAIAGPVLTCRWTRRFGTVCGLIGLAMMVAACVVLDKDTVFPGYAALLPVLGCALVLLGGQRTDLSPTPVTRALGVKPLSVLGDWSFSLYLWHWPLLVLPVLAMGRSMTDWELFVALFATLSFSAVSYNLIELPFREGWHTHASMRSLLLYPICLGTVLGLAVSGWYWVHDRAEGGDNPAITAEDYASGSASPTPGDASSSADPQDPRPEVALDPIAPLVRASVLAARDDKPIPSDLSPDLLSLRDDIAPITECDYGQGSRELCAYGDTDAERTIVLTGDSHGRMWIPALDRIAEEAGYRVYHLVKPQCTSAYVTPASLDDGTIDEDCVQFRKWAAEQIEELDPELVVVSTSPPVGGIFADGELITDTDDVAAHYRRGIADLFRTLRPAAEEVRMIADVPKVEEDPATCLSESGNDLGDCLSAPEQTSWDLRALTRTVAREQEVGWIDTEPWFCFDGECPSVVGNIAPLRDRDHVTTTYAERLWAELGVELGLLRPAG